MHARLAHGVTRDVPALGRALAQQFFKVFASELATGLAERLVLVPAPDAVGGLPPTLLLEAFQQGLDDLLTTHQYDLTVASGAMYPSTRPAPAYEQWEVEARATHWAKADAVFQESLEGQVVVVVDYVRMSGAKEAFLTRTLAQYLPQALVFCTLAAAPKDVAPVIGSVTHAYRRWGAHTPTALLKLLGTDPVRVTPWLVHRLAKEFIGSEWQLLAKSAQPQLLTGLAQYLQAAAQPLPTAERNLQLVVEAALHQRRSARTASTTRKPPRRAK